MMTDIIISFFLSNRYICEVLKSNIKMLCDELR